MKIVLNVTPAMREVTGIGTYAAELSQALLELDRGNDYTLFYSRRPFSKNPRNASLLKNKRADFRTTKMPYRVLNFLWNEAGVLPVEGACGECDIFHSMDMFSPLAKTAKLVTTIHDTNWLVFDDNSAFRKKALYRQVSRSLERSRLIITDSDFTKTETLKYFPFLKEAGIEVVPLGVSERFRPMDRSSVNINRERFGWGAFLLYVGVLDQSRKNLANLIKAYSKLKRSKGVSERLVLCGRASRGAERLYKLIEDLNLEKDVLIYNRWIPDSAMPILYNMAKVVIYPSLYEGFGLPVLEAMACGKPVVASRRASIPEVGGEAAYYLNNPDDPGEMADLVHDLVTDDDLCSKLSCAGLSRAKTFTWEETAKNTLAAYEKIF